MRIPEGSVHPSSWPQSMSLQLDGLPHHILELLYLRRAWGIAADIALPGLDPLPQTGASKLPCDPEKFLWEVRWKKKWKQVWNAQVAGQFRVPGTAILSTGSGTGRYPEFWRAEFGVSGFDQEAFEGWEQHIHESFGRQLLQAAHHEQVEPVIIAAWERGLKHVTALPWQGQISLRLGEGHLVTTLGTLDDAQQFRTALAQWIKDKPL